MNSDEFWCRAFLTAMGDYAGDLARCEEIANAAQWRAQRRGMVTASASAQPVTRRDPEAVEFAARRVGDMWNLISPDLDGGIVVHGEQLTYPLAGGVVAHIKWSEVNGVPMPFEARIERGGA